MRRSPFGFSGSNMGGGRGGNIHMLRSIQRVCKAGEGISRSPRNSSTSSSTTTAGGKYSDNKNKSGNSSVLTLSSSTSPRKTTASVVATTWPSCPSPTLTEESDEWEFINGIDIDTVQAQQTCFDDVVFGRPPSSDEVQQAFHSLQGAMSYSDKGVAYQVFSPTGSVGGDSAFGASADWEEPSPHLCNSRMLSPRRLDQGDVYNALSLLQKDHDIQLIVESISTDEAVWNAIKNNEVVCELRRAYLQADVNSVEGSNGDSVEGSDGDSGDSNGATHILSWFVTKVKAKIMELMQNITKTLDQLLGGGTEAEKNVDHFDRKVKLSLVVTVALFLAVVLQRMKLAGNSST